MKVVYCHPENKEHFDLLSKKPETPGSPYGALIFTECFGLPIIFSYDVPRLGVTGNYVNRSTQESMDKHNLKVKEPFVTYGPEDIDYLLYCGKVTKEIGPVLWAVEEPEHCSVGRMRWYTK